MDSTKTAEQSQLEAELAHHLDFLSEKVGPRPVGSPANLAALRYISGLFSEAGLMLSEQRFDCPDWTCASTQLELDGKPLTAAANTYSIPCDVTAPTVVLSTIAELEAADLSGKIGVLCGELTQSALTPKNLHLYTIERDQQIIALLEAKQPAALITVNLGYPSLERLIEDRDLAIPSATVAADVGLSLAHRAGANVHLRIDSRRAPSFSANIVGRTASPERRRIVLCAHYDTKIETPGAYDNASGVSALLTLVKRLLADPPGVDLEFVAFSDEEYFGQDDAAYMRDSGDHMGSVLATINMDAIGEYLGANTIAIMAHSEAFEARVKAITADFPGVKWVDPWPMSDHSIFAWRGVPCLAISSYFAGMPRLAHQPYDTKAWISPARLAEVVTLVEMIVRAIAAEPLMWSRPPAEA